MSLYIILQIKFSLSSRELDVRQALGSQLGGRL